MGTYFDLVLELELELELEDIGKPIALHKYI